MIAALVAPRVTPGSDGEGGGQDEGHVLFLQLVAVRARCVECQSMMEILYFFLFSQSTLGKVAPKKLHRRRIWHPCLPRLLAPDRATLRGRGARSLSPSSERTQRNGERAGDSGRTSQQILMASFILAPSSLSFQRAHSTSLCPENKTLYVIAWLLSRPPRIRP